MNKVEIYIDGSCSGNPGPIGWAAICHIGEKTYMSGGYNSDPEGTNNRAELNGAICGLKALKAPCDVTFYTDSSYLVTCCKHTTGWLTESGRSNSDLWFELIQETHKGGHKVKFVKVKGHSNNKFNELADKYARAECAKARHEMRRR